LRSWGVAFWATPRHREGLSRECCWVEPPTKRLAIPIRVPGAEAD
jgi:hypothetical protein